MCAQAGQQPVRPTTIGTLLQPQSLGLPETPALITMRGIAARFHSLCFLTGTLRLLIRLVLNIDKRYVSNEESIPREHFLPLTLSSPSTVLLADETHMFWALTHTPRTLANSQCNTQVSPQKVFKTSIHGPLFCSLGLLSFVLRLERSKSSPSLFSSLSPFGRRPTCITLSRYKTVEWLP
jgi:hypothetical protein